MRHLLNLTNDELQTWLREQGQPSYRAAQIIKWLYKKRVERFEEMTDLPADLRKELAEAFLIWSSLVVEHRQAADGTEKLLLELSGAGRIECVLLRSEDRRSICISSQVGCAMGCVFCASGLDGVDRNLTAGEIIEQMLLLQRLLPQEERLSNIVAMGMGEPLANLDALLPSLDMASRDEGLAISKRRISISTVGLPNAIRRLADQEKSYQLAVSLHAANDTLRSRLVPVNKNIGLEEILAATDYFFEVTSRRLTFEYVLLAGVNDSSRDAQELLELLRGRAAMLNVIPYNPVAGLPYKTPSAASVARFGEILYRGGLNVKFRHRKGDKIDAACGQLRRSLAPSPTPS